MSEVTVLDIPLQNSLTPTVGTYSDEGRQDTTFVYDSELDDYSLHGVNNTSTGYYFYYPEIPIVAGSEIYLEFDFKATTYSGSYMPIISLNKSSSANSNIPILIEQDGRDICINWNQSRPITIRVDYNEWHHCKFGLWVDISNNSTYYILRIDSEIRTSTSYNVTVITDLTVLGDTTDNSSPSNVYIKNIKVSIKTSGNNFILFNAGNEQLRAYASFPEKYTSTLKGTINFEHLLTAEGVLNNQKYIYTIPLDNAVNKSIIVRSPSQNESITVNQSIVFDSSFNEYVIQTKYNSYSFEIFPNEPDTLGTDDTKRVCIDYKICITNWNNNTKFFLMSLGGQDPANTGTSNALRLTCTNTGKIRDEFDNNPMSTNTFNPTDLSIQLNTIYKITIYAEIDALRNKLKIEVYIDGNLRYAGTSAPSSFSIGDFDACFFYKQWLGNSCKIKLGSINIYNGYPNTWYKKLNVKRNNNLYYLLASNTGLYPSRLRAKIDGTTYPILLKHDEDNTSE